MKNTCSIFLSLLLSVSAFAQPGTKLSPREHLPMDFNWRFAFGHPYDTKKDFNTGTGYFSYFAKASYGDGASAANFDDRSWRTLDLPHDWAVELPFDSAGSYSHGFKALGRNFPDASVGWYRKTFNIPASDLGKHITIAFDGVFRNCIVWVNGFYLGTEPSGYNSFEYNITDYLNYGGENTIAVRVDATMEEGWFYEGAGIYRHIWLNKTSALHVATNGTFVTSLVQNDKAVVTAKISLINENKISQTVNIIQAIKDADGNTLATEKSSNTTLTPYEEKELSNTMELSHPKLWSIDSPYLHQLTTSIFKGDTLIDSYVTTFGIRTIRFDASNGFFLNGKHLKIKGSDNHQDHAGVGVALPDDLIYYRIKTLKAFGSNAIRCSHNPPTPELLDACDELGMLVIDENRLMGVSSTHLNDLKRMIMRDRNHPSIISWSIGNEEWGIEGNGFGAAIASTMQAFAKSIDTTRAITAAISGGWQKGISNVIDVMGVNYIGQINTDEHHAEFPNQPMWGTEEGATLATRGIYFNDSSRHYMAAYDRKPYPNFFTIENGWKYYTERNYLAGMFIWTGFDYRGEPSPFGFPSTGSNHGMMDQCGFPKDLIYYLKSWWTDEVVLHILPHWNWKGREGEDIDVWAYSNCDEVELFLNKKSLGRKKMQPNSHLEWKTKYVPGILEATGYKNGKKIASDKIQTTGAPVAIQMAADKNTIDANKTSLSLVTVEVRDKNNLHVPTADNTISLAVSGPGKIIGVGNGDPSSLEPDKFIEAIKTVQIENMHERVLNDSADFSLIKSGYDDSKWDKAFKDDRTGEFGRSAKSIVYRGRFIMPANFRQSTVTLFYKPIGKLQSIYINGKLIASGINETGSNTAFTIDSTILNEGVNLVAIVASPLIKKHTWDEVNKDPGLFQILTPAPAWKVKLFNGLAQVIIQSTDAPGEIVLKASSGQLQPQELKILSTRVHEHH